MRLIGRERELSALSQALSANRLVSVWGPSGVGKTRLVREAVDPAARFCSLAGVETEADLERAILRCFGADARDIARVLARMQGTLVLDGADGALPFLADRVERWLAAAPRARIVVTALSPLGLDIEMELELSALSHDAALTLYTEAIRERGGCPDPEIARKVVERLERLPHALESFAPIAALSTDAASLERLERALGDRALDRALELAIGALEPDDRAALVQLSVFETGVSTSVLERLFAEGLSRVEPLLRRSLVRIEQGSGGSPRVLVYRAAARALAPASEHETRRHAEAVLTTLEALDLERTSSRLTLATERQELLAIARRFADADPELAARACSLQVPLALLDGSAAELATRLEELALRLERESDLAQHTELSLGKLCRRLGQLEESRQHLERALERKGASRFEALLELAHLERMQSRTEAAFAGYERALTEAREAADAHEVVALGEIGRMLQSAGRFREAQEQHVRAIALAKNHALPHREALERSLHARATHRAGNVKQAIPLHEHALSLHREHGERRLAAAELGHLGFCHHEALDLPRAERCFRESIAGLEESGDVALENIERTLLARLLADAGRFEEARLELALVEAACRDLAMPRIDATRHLVHGLVELGEGRLEPARRELEAALESGNPVEVGFESLLHDYLALADAPDRAREHLEQASRAIASLDHPGLSLAHALLSAAVRSEPLPLVEHSVLAASSDARRALSLAERFGSSNVLEVAADGRELWLPDGTHVELKRSGAPRRLLLRLVEARIERPGVALGSDDLVSAGWPGERMQKLAADKRLRTAIWTLRRSGLGELLLTREAGYLLDPLTSVRIRQPKTA